MKKIFILLIFLWAAACVISVVNATEPTGYSSVTGPCNLEFPHDHGAHPGYRTEWWYYTGNLQAPSGEKYGFQLTFFRSQIRPSDDRQRWPKPTSAWRTQPIYLAHSAISNLTAKQHLQAERVSREALSMAGAKQLGDTTHVFLNDWSVSIGPDRHLLKVKSDEFSYALTLTPQKPPVLHGIAGYSRKGSTPERASCYYSFTRLMAQGRISSNQNTAAVNGLAWMDHEYSTAPLEPGLQGWDWFSLQLSDQTEIMAFVLRKEKGEIGLASSATFIDKQGQKRHIRAHEFGITVLKTWKSRHSKAVYPAGWRLQIFPIKLDLTIVPNMADQEMRTYASTGLNYWEGSVAVEGLKIDQPVFGQGYAELTGYASPFKAPM
jgi:predicted secreted hydrolase